MEEQQPNNNINFYLTEKNKKAVLNDSTPYERYIIISNETLQIENRELSEKLKTSEYKVDDLESQMDKEEISKTYMRGLLKNLAELNKLFNDVNLINKQIIENNYDYIKVYKNKARRHLRFLQGFFIMLIAYVFEFYNIYNFIGFTILLSIITAFQESMLFNLSIVKNIEETQQIKEIEKEIKLITDGQDHLDDYINCL